MKANVLVTVAVATENHKVLEITVQHGEFTCRVLQFTCALKDGNCGLQNKMVDGEVIESGHLKTKKMGRRCLDGFGRNRAWASGLTEKT